MYSKHSKPFYRRQFPDLQDINYMRMSYCKGRIQNWSVKKFDTRQLRKSAVETHRLVNAWSSQRGLSQFGPVVGVSFPFLSGDVAVEEDGDGTSVVALRVFWQAANPIPEGAGALYHRRRNLRLTMMLYI